MHGFAGESAEQSCMTGEGGGGAGVVESGWKLWFDGEVTWRTWTLLDEGGMLEGGGGG